MTREETGGAHFFSQRVEREWVECPMLDHVRTRHEEVIGLEAAAWRLAELARRE